MRDTSRTLAVALAIVAAASMPAGAQTPAPVQPTTPPAPSATTPAPPPPTANIVVEKPTYVSLVMEVTVDRPAADVWKRVGGYCAIGEWFQMAERMQDPGG